MTIRAAARGIVDFSKADIMSVNWWRRTNVLIQAMMDDDHLVSLRSLLSFHLALLGNGMLKDDGFQTAQTKGKELLNEIINVVQPWESTSADELQRKQANSLADVYRSAIGDPNDPAVKAMLEQAINVFEKLKSAAKKETDDERVKRQALEKGQARELKKNPPGKKKTRL